MLTCLFREQPCPDAPLPRIYVSSLLGHRQLLDVMDGEARVLSSLAYAGYCGHVSCPPPNL
jgi:hypothetical protein